MSANKDVYSVEVLGFEEVHSTPGFWDPDRYRRLLDLFDFDDIDSIADGDLLEMAAMAAQDEGLKKASDRVLEAVFKDTMSSGVRQNLVDDLTDDRPWEQFADLDRQSRIFATVEFLQKAFPTEFGIPDAARVRIRVQTAGTDAIRWLRDGPEPALVLRLLASAMEEGAVLRRLYEEKLASPPFPEAVGIVWRSAVLESDWEARPVTCDIEVDSSLQWLEPLRGRRGVHASLARPDRAG